MVREPIRQTELPAILATIHQQSGLVREAFYGTMLPNDIYDLCGLDAFVERMDNTARIIDVKYYSLLPASSFVGNRLDNVQWETILRSVSAHRSFRWAVEEDLTAPALTDFLILDRHMPRSLAFCAGQIVSSLSHLVEGYGSRPAFHELADTLWAQLVNRYINSIDGEGLHEFFNGLIQSTADRS